MAFKYFLSLLFFITNFATAQNLLLENEIRKIDNHIIYGRFDKAQQLTNTLYNQIKTSSSKKEYQNELLELQFRKALILDRQEEAPSKLLKILQETVYEAEDSHLFSLSYRIYLLMALCYEKVDNFDLADKYLNLAYQLYEKYDLESIYSTYCVRRSSYYRYINKLDSVLYFAKQAYQYAGKYQNETDLIDSYILLSFVANRTKNYSDALKYSFRLLQSHKKHKDTTALASTFNSIARQYLSTSDFQKAMLYNDSSRIFYKSKPTLIYNIDYPKTRYELFEAMGNIDSAYYYLKEYQHEWESQKAQEEKVKAKELEERYESDKKEIIIKDKNKQMIFIGALLGAIVIASVLLIRKNKKIGKQNRIISTQVDELSKTLGQKQMLLSELQHRVKNNLQHIISILEIQKESVDFNNIDELIRGNQNRIHSMALLHKKLNTFDQVNTVELNRYITELSELVKNSYDNYKKKINLNIQCDIATMSIEKALPLGLIVVELISNSMKYAFKNKKVGIIDIKFAKSEMGNHFCYNDNGCGYDFNFKNDTGLGQEIIKGLIDQLDGKISTNEESGFELIVYFK